LAPRRSLQARSLPINGTTIFVSVKCDKEKSNMASQNIDAPKQIGEEGSASTAPDNNGKDEWDEARLEEGLKTLKEMHIQVRLSVNAFFLETRKLENERAGSTSFQNL